MSAAEERDRSLHPAQTAQLSKFTALHCLEFSTSLYSAYYARNCVRDRAATHRKPFFQPSSVALLLGSRAA